MSWSRILATRPLRGARSCFGAGLALAWLVLGTAPAAALRPEGPGPLPWHVGGLIGGTVDLAAFPEPGGHRLEVYLRLRPETIAALTDRRRFDGAIRLTARVGEGTGRNWRQAQQDFEFTTTEAATGFGRVVVFPFKVKPGPHRIQVKLEAKHRLLPGTGTGKTETGAVDGEFEVLGSRDGREISSIQFVWSEGDSVASRFFERGERRRVPNPERLYGLYANTLRASVAAQAPPGDRRPWRWSATLHEAGGAQVARQDSTGAAGERLEADARFEVSTLPAGGYDLRFRVWQEGDPAPLERGARLSVGWEVDTWERGAREIEDEAHFLLTKEEEERFALLQPGEREKRLAEFWRDHDPTPETAENEAKRRFHERVDFANRTYGRFGLGKGMFSDMGRVFIRYGEPNEVYRSVLPGADHELLRLLDQHLTAGDRPVGDIDDATYGPDMRPFEFWIYQGQILPPPDADPKAEPVLHLRRRLIFLFVDEQWLGDFRLVYSTE
jgi:GWxTD domain-containing protein